MSQERARALIDLEALCHNYRLLGQIVAPNSKVMAVVKANAYGHGDGEVARALEAQGCQFFGVASIKEALRLRQHGIRASILVFGIIDPQDAFSAAQNDIIITIQSSHEAAELEALKIPLRAHIKVDTGMSRLGMACRQQAHIDACLSDIQTITQFAHIHIEGIYTHFAEAENEDTSFTRAQFTRFSELISLLDSVGMPRWVKHCCNSSATLRFPEMHLDFVRSGIALYGYPQTPTTHRFLPVMTFKANVVALRELDPGESISYGRTFIATRKMKVATLAIGYADGLSRSLSNRFALWFNGHAVNIVGTICMDMTLVDVTNINLSIGDEVEVFGAHRPISEVSKAMQTIDYEVLTSVSHRPDRIIISPDESV
ncbi:MAG: alanine racemase [Candidatus Izemoplasmatales bacterium]|nr:alanine racemase [Candidatus Izemoplasmatales bacterium]